MPGGLRGAERDRGREGGMKRESTVSFKALFLIPKCNTPISMLIRPVTAEMDARDRLADAMHTKRRQNGAIT